VLVIGSLIGLVWGMFLIAFRGAGRRTRIPFGPSLAAAGALFLLLPPIWTARLFALVAVS